MAFEMLVTVTTLGFAAFFLATNIVRADIVGVLVILTLAISGVLTLEEALAGFSNPAVLIIAAMFLVSESIVYTGIGQRIGTFIIDKGGSGEKKLLTMLFFSTGLVGAFMSSTATVAIFLPIAMAMANKADLNHRRLLLPLAAASVISGMLTLVATTPNIVINNMLKKEGLEPFTFFSFTPYGVAVLLLGAGFMVHFGKNWLDKEKRSSRRRAEPSINDLIQYYGLEERWHRLRVPARSGVVGRTVAHLNLRERYRVKLVALQRMHEGKKVLIPVNAGTVFFAGDLLIAFGHKDKIAVFSATFQLAEAPFFISETERRRFAQDIGAAEVMLTPTSSLIGKSVGEIRFQSLFDCLVMGIRRERATVTTNVVDEPLRFGDVLLVFGAWKDLLRLREHRDKYLLLTLPEDYHEVVPARHRAPLTLAILTGMVVCMVFDFAPTVIAVIGAAVALVLCACIQRASIYRVVEWQSIVLIAGILALPVALQKTGVLDGVTTKMLTVLGHGDPLLVLTVLFLVTAVGGMFLSNTPMAVLVTPVALKISLETGIPPQACAMTVAIACSAVFASPFGSPVNMMVREPGGYVFGDYIKIGVPLMLIALGVTLVLTQWLYLS